MDIIKIENLNKSFYNKGKEVEVLKNINLNISEGEFISIIGSSGCGKSTLLRIIAGLETEYDGKVTFNEDFITSPSRDKGFIFQSHRLLPWLTVEENIAFTLPSNMQNKDKLIKKHIEIVGLAGFEKAYPSQLSGGMAQRASIARALANKPKVLLLDEPFGALDAITKINMQEEILRLWEIEKITMILVTHDIEEAVYLGDRVVVMSNRPGQIKTISNVNLGKPRIRTSVDFTNEKKVIYKEFFKDVEPAFIYSI